MEGLLGSNEGVQRGISSGFEGRVQQNDHIDDAADWPVVTMSRRRLSLIELVYERFVRGGKQHSRAEAVTDRDTDGRNDPPSCIHFDGCRLDRRENPSRTERRSQAKLKRRQR